MGTSNWQNIPYCIDALMKMEPMRVLDIGVGFGRWGVLVREFCEVWFNRIHPGDWEIDLQGVEAFEPNIEDYHHHFYSKIHIGDAAEVVEKLPGRWDVVLFGDVLEHFTKEVAEGLLNLCLERSDYVMVNIPIGAHWEQDEMYGNPYEEHLSEWESEDFKAFHLVREESFDDFSGRPFGVFILSKKDPKDLKGSLFSKDSDGAAAKGGPSANAHDAELRRMMSRVERRAREMAFELEFLKKCRPVRKLLKKPGKMLRSMGRWRKNGIRVAALNQKNPESEAASVALLGARSEEVTGGLPWYVIQRQGEWVLRDHRDGHYSKSLVIDGEGELRMVLRGRRPRLLFQCGPSSGKVSVTRRGCEQVVDLYAPQAGLLEVDPKEPEAVASVVQPAGVEMPGVDVEEVLARVKGLAVPHLAISVQGWLGVGNATRMLFEATLPLAAVLDDAELTYWARRISASGAGVVTLSGVTPSHLELAQRLKASGMRIQTLWHGNYLQAREDFAWRVLKSMTEAAKSGVIDKVGFVKKGMAEWLAGLGVNTAFVMNYVPEVPAGPSAALAGGPHLGLWISNEGYRKMPYAMLAAISMIEGAVVHGAGLSARALDFLRFNGLDEDHVRPRPLPFEDLQGEMAACHLNLYVTLSECCPMLPLESLARGVPCLTGPNSHLFEDDEFLRERLVVSHPEHADVIAVAARRALDERDAIIQAYKKYAPGYIERARRSVQEFLAE